MIGPARAVRRDDEEGLWEGSTGFAVRLDNQDALLCPSTVVRYSRDDPMPAEESSCTIGEESEVEVGRGGSPSSLAGPVYIDAAPAVVEGRDVTPDLPGFEGLEKVLGSASDQDARSIQIVVKRDEGYEAIRGTLRIHDEPQSHVRFVLPPGGINAVTYESKYEIEVESDLSDRDVGAPILAERQDDRIEAIGILLDRVQPRRALVTDLMDIFGTFPTGTQLL